MFEPFDGKTASPTDRAAYVLCQIIDDDAPLRWTRFRFAVDCIVTNPRLMRDLSLLAQRHASTDDLPDDYEVN